jgi:hypothetical protein
MTKPAELSHEQRMVLCEMVAGRLAERHRLRLRIADVEIPWSQARWDLLSRELTLLYVLLGEVKKTNPMFVEIKEADKKAFWQECQSQFARASVAAHKPLAQRKHEPRSDPNLAYR